MNWLDLLIVAFLGFELWKGSKNGLMNELGSILGIILGFTLASVTNESLAVFCLILILSKIFEGFLKVFALNWLNQIAGAFFSVMKGLLVVSVVVNLLLFIDFKSRIISENAREKSLIFEKVSKIAPAVFPKVQLFKHTLEPDNTKNNMEV